MSADCILAIDQGTTNTKAMLVDATGAIVAQASRPVAVSYPQPAWVEQDPRVLWSSVQQAMDECLVAVSAGRLAAVAWLPSDSVAIRTRLAMVRGPRCS